MSDDETGEGSDELNETYVAVMPINPPCDCELPGGGSWSERCRFGDGRGS